MAAIPGKRQKHGEKHPFAPCMRGSHGICQGDRVFAFASSSFDCELPFILIALILLLLDCGKMTCVVALMVSRQDNQSSFSALSIDRSWAGG